MSDFLILDVGGHLAASKRKSYREEIRVVSQTFVNFLQDNNLTTRQIVPLDGSVTDELKIYRSDLRDLGYQVVQRKFHEWLRSISNGSTQPNDCSMLEEELDQIRKS